MVTNKRIWTARGKNDDKEMVTREQLNTNWGREIRNTWGDGLWTGDGWQAEEEKHWRQIGEDKEEWFATWKQEYKIIEIFTQTDRSWLQEPHKLPLAGLSLREERSSIIQEKHGVNLLLLLLIERSLLRWFRCLLVTSHWEETPRMNGWTLTSDVSEVNDTEPLLCWSLIENMF